MRDIRGDLQERGNLFEQQINAAQAEFEKLLEQLKKEQDSRLDNLKAELEAVNRVMEIERRRATSAPKPQQSQQPQPQQPLANFLVRKLSEAGPMSSGDLCHLAVQEGYFADGDSAEQGVHATLTHVVKAGQIQQLSNANFVPTVVTDTTKLRRAI